jgi:hypothetical protein
VSNSSNIAATADATKVRFSLFQELGLKNRFAIGLSPVPARVRLVLASLTAPLCPRNPACLTVYVTAKHANPRMKDLSSNIFWASCVALTPRNGPFLRLPGA